MPEQALYLKWRPLSFDDMVGQEHITRTLRNSLKTGRIRHAYLFSGPRGTGKTTSARLLAKAVNCTHEDPEQRPCNACEHCTAVNEGRYLDLIEIDAATHTGVDDVRDLRERIAFAPGQGRYKIYIIDEVHRFSGSAFDALLKTLEEPPDHAIFVLATTEIDKVPATIKSRCLQFEFRRLSLAEVVDRLRIITKSEGLQVEPVALELIARSGTGSVRDSISLLDQIVSDPHEIITLELTQRILGTTSLHAVAELVEAIIQQDVPRGLHIINQTIDSGSDPRQFAQQVVEQLRAVLLAQAASADLIEASDEERDWYTARAALATRSALLRAIRAFNEATARDHSGWQPQLALELALIESTQGQQEVVYVAAPSAAAPAPGPAAAPAGPAYEPPAPSEPGEPPAVPLAQVRERWTDVKKQAYRYHPNLPALMDHAQVWQVDGNRVILAVMEEFFLQKLSDPERANIIARALHDVHQVKLRVQVVMSPEGGHAPTGPGTPSPDDDPLLAAGLELGGEIHPDE